MASNHTQPLPPENSPLDRALDASLEDHDAGLQRRFNQAFEPNRVSNNGLQSAPALPSSNAPTHKILNDAYLIQSRRIYSNQKARKSFDLMCEDKISKYKLEEVHFSLPSSVKSTLIMTFSPDGRKVASTHGDHRIYICDLNTGKLLDTLEGHPKTPCCLAWHRSNRNILASGCLAGEVRVWDLRSKACESWTSENNGIITSLDFHPKERVLVIATNNDIYFWDWSDTDPFAKTTTTHDKEKVKFVEFDSSGTKLVTGICNLPKYAGYSSDSLQNRIIDSYLNQGNLDQPSAENMTQHSEITNPLSGNPSSYETFNDRNSSSSRPLVANNTEQDINYRSTLTLSRVAFLYRQLEGLEDSMRHTSFSPYITPQLDTAGSTAGTPEPGAGGETVQDSSINQQSDDASRNQTMNDNEVRPHDREQIPSSRAPSQGINIESQTYQANDSPSSRSAITPYAFEPFLVSFDESLEQLQLPSLVIDGQALSFAGVIEQYPVEMPYQLHYVMQYESINQVNQNFIRISKLMSSVRLYRQIVQQILASNSGQTNYQPNQILTAQSASPRSTRHASNMPIVFRNFTFGNPADSGGLGRSNRATDPILAIQYRNAARNVPLVTVCKIDLLSARSVCTMRSQQLIEQSLASLRQQIARNQAPQNSNTERDRTVETKESEPMPSSSNSSGDNEVTVSYYPLLNQLHQSLTNINHAPLTTSNVHTHITSLRTLVNKLLTTLSSIFRTREEGQRLNDLIHDIAHSLTGRSWSIPLGATLDDIRLDVIHTLCIVDLTLHFTRQVQLLQMQRLSALTRIEESKRTASTLNRDPTRGAGGVSNASASNLSTNQQESTNPNTSSASASNTPSTSRGGDNDVSLAKRKESELSAVSSDCGSKRRKVDTVDQKNTLNSNSANNMIETQSVQLAEVTANQSDTGVQIQNQTAEQNPSNQSSAMQGSLPESLSADRLVLWNSHTQAVEQSLQRFLVATTSSMNNSHILVRIYHRLYGTSAIPSSNTIDQPSNRSNLLPHESRRRALSQDNSSVSGTLESVSPTSEEARNRQAHLIQNASGLNNSNNVDPLAGSRHPHLHIYQTRGSGQHLWFNQYTIPLPVNNCNYRIQCWDFSLTAVPNIKNSQSKVVTQKCRIHNYSSIDISSDGGMIACLVPRDDGACIPSLDLKVFSLKTYDFGVCYYQLPHGSNAISVSLSPSAGYAVVGSASAKFISSDPSDDDITIGKIFKLGGRQSHGFVRDITIKRDDSSLSLNAIRWMPRGIVYNVGPQHHPRYQATRMRNRVA